MGDQVTEDRASARADLDVRHPSCIVLRVSSTLLAGLVAWAAGLVLVPAPMAARILLLAALVIVPRLLALLPARRWIGRMAGWPALAAAVPLLAAFDATSGPLAAALALPWLALALTGALSAAIHGLGHLPAILRPGNWTELGVDVALAFWAVGAGFVVVDRLGLATGFSPAIVLLTATHFHFAGLGLLGLASLLARDRPWLRASVAGLAIGIPVTALGFVLVSDAVNAIGALVVGTAGIGVGLGLLTVSADGAARWASRLAGIAVLIGMPMGIAWSIAILSGQTFLDLDTMIRTHGALNATAVFLTVTTYRSEGS